MPKYAEPLEDMPEFIRLAAPNALFTLTEIYKVFGFSGVSSIYYAFDAGMFPKPDKQHLKHGKLINLWNAKTIRSELKRRQEEHKARHGQASMA
jgi:hypothetical protein